MCSQGIEGCRSDTAAATTSTDCCSIMESTTASSPAAPDETPRVKFLCSFGGSILPRPLDGRLRYVGGETRIVSVPRDVSYDDLLARMLDLFEGAAVIKYQQPDEDLDALVSVVNDDDVMNMMEEYDKLGATGDGFTRLRIFLFSQQHQEHDASSDTTTHFDTDERETERRYVDALNSLADAKSSPDASEQFSSYLGSDCMIHNQASLHHLNIPHPSHGQRYGEVEASWSPAYFSPGHHPGHDPREFPPSPSSRFHLAAGEFTDRISAEEYVRQSPGLHPIQQDNQSLPHMENMLWLPPGAVIHEKAGFPSNLGHAHNVFEGSSICEQCRMAFPRSQATLSDPRYLDPRWKHGQQPHMETNTGNEYMGYFSNSCADCYRNKEAYMLNPQDVKLDHGVYDHRPVYNEAQGHDRGWALHHHQVGHRLEDPRVHPSGSVRMGDHYVVDGNAVNAPFAHGNFYEGHPGPFSCINNDDTRYIRPGTELGNEMFHAQQTVGGGPHTQILGFEDTAVRYGNHPSTFGADNLYQVQQNLAPIQSLRRKAQVPMRPGMPYELPGLMMPNGGTNSGFIRSPQEGSPRLSRIAMENQIQNSWVAQNGGTSQKIHGFDGSATPEYPYDQGPRMNQNITGQDGRLSIVPDSVQCQPRILPGEIPSEVARSAPTLLDDKLVGSPAFGYHDSSKMGIDIASRTRTLEEKNPVIDAYGTKHEETKSDVHMIPSPKENPNSNFDSKVNPSGDECHTAKLVESDANAAANEHGDVSVECLSFLPELIASVKKAALVSAEVVKARVEANGDENVSSGPNKKESSFHELEPGNVCLELEADSDGEVEHPKTSKIEPTTAEAEALDKGLQTIRNDDLEEIRELGSGTYGSVYHGKWKGSDVAIKRIKASCFAGRPSERERLIADFWKEALILSSLHHPNVVSFYGVVRDGPDGSLATVTEFMVNGSLKQFLQKKDRTIDRRKRLIIAMDAAFGMEYLHGKNIVHFDLKCENLLVNMRDPHRPVCKIGDLGLSKVKQHTLVSGGVRGTLPWMAPELLSGKSNMVTEKIDVYSFGIVMWELLTGEEPYADMHCASVIGGIVNNTLRPQIPTWCDPEWRSLMESCWSSDPGERPSFSEISARLRKMSAAINVK